MILLNKKGTNQVKLRLVAALLKISIMRKGMAINKKLDMMGLKRETQVFLKSIVIFC